MDAEREAREIVTRMSDCEGEPVPCCSRCECKPIADRIAAALRRAHDAGRAEALEEAAREALKRRAAHRTVAAIRALKDAPHG